MHRTSRKDGRLIASIAERDCSTSRSPGFHSPCMILLRKVQADFASSVCGASVQNICSRLVYYQNCAARNVAFLRRGATAEDQTGVQQPNHFKPRCRDPRYQCKTCCSQTEN